MEVYQLSNILHDGIRPLHSLKHWRYHNTEEACHGNPFSRMSEQPFSHPGEEETTMMGLKERAFAPLVAVSLEELVPQDHFYRYLQRTLDLSFLHELVRECYAAVGRPSIDPVVFFKLYLGMFFEDFVLW